MNTSIQPMKLLPHITTETPIAPEYGRGLKVSTIGTDDLIPVATGAVKRFTKHGNFKIMLRYFGSHYTMDDLVMDAVEKVIRANPMYLTKSYVITAVKCVCIDLLQKKKIPWSEVQTLFTFEDGDEVLLEDLLEGDAYDHIEDVEEKLKGCLGEEESEIYDGLNSQRLYVDIAKDLGLSMRTFERKVHDLKWKITYILTEEVPI